MDCCSVNGLDQMFDQANARKELKAYWKKGLDKRARLLVDFLKAQDLAGSSLLEIGFGIGALHLELLKAGAGKAVGVEASPAYLQAARALAEQLGLQDAVVYQRMDFAQRGQEVAEADIVLLDRVICCYPDMVGLVTSSAQHARRFYALTFPRGAWWMRLAGFLFNAFMALTRKTFRVFLHAPQEVNETVRCLGFSQVFHTFSGPWEVVVFQRQG